MGYWENEVGDVIGRDLAAYEARLDAEKADAEALEATARDIAEQALEGYGAPLKEQEADEALVELVADALQENMAGAREAFRDLMREVAAMTPGEVYPALNVARAAQKLRETLLEASVDALAERARHQLEIEREEAAVADAEARGLIP